MIVTLSLAGDIQQRFDTMRRRWFPAERNLVPAHVTLFHALPDDSVDEASAALASVGRDGFVVDVTGVRMLGRGVAFDLASPGLSTRRSMIAHRFAGRLSRQDSAPYRPHVTVQNKVTAEEARALHALLSASFVAERAEAGALHLWRYLGGPWEALMTVPLDPQRGGDRHAERIGNVPDLTDGAERLEPGA